MAYTKPDVIVRQEFQNLSATPVLETLQAVIIGPSYKKIKDDDANSTAKKIDYPYANEAMEFNMPDLPAECIVDVESLGIRISNKNNSISVNKTVFKGNAEDSANLEIAENADRDAGDYFVKVAVAAAIEGVEVNDVLTISSVPYDGEYVIKAVAEDGKSFVIDMDDEDKFDDVEAGRSVANVSISISSPGFTYDEENKKFFLSGKLGISGSIYLSGKAFRRDKCDKMFMCRASDLEDVFGKGEVNSENPLALGMQLALANAGGGEDVAVAGIMVESDDVFGYQKAFEMLEASEVYAMVPLTTNLVIPQVLMMHVDAMSKPEEKHERVGIFASPWMNREVKAGQLMIQQEDGSYDFVKGQITTSGRPLDDNFLCVAGTGMFDEQSYEFGDSDLSLKVVGAEIVGFDRETMEGSFSFKLDDEEVAAQFEDGRLEIKADRPFHKVTFKSNSSFEDVKIRIFAYGDSSLKAGTYEYDQIFNSIASSKFDGSNFRALRVKVIDAETGEEYEGEELPEGLSLSVKCKDMDAIVSNKIMTHSYDMPIQSVKLSGDVSDRYAIIVIGLKSNGTLKINRLVGGDTDPDVASFMSSGVSPRDELVIIDKSQRDANTYSGFKETRYRVEKAKKENEVLIDAVWDEDIQDWDRQRVFPEAVAEVYYRIESPVLENKREIAQMYANISSSYHDRRMTHIFAPYVGISENNEEHQVPGYYFACAYAGMTQGQQPQQGFTNMGFAGFTKVLFTNDYFTESQMNIIAGGGTVVVEQVSAGALLTCRHQLTTNMDSIEEQEYSITRIMDYVAKCARSTNRRYIGKNNITPGFLKTLMDVANSIIETMQTEGVILAGSSVQKVAQHDTQKDKVVECYRLNVPYPCNYIDITLVV